MSDRSHTIEFGPGCDETGQINYDLSPRGVSYGKPFPSMRNHDCRVDGHSDPDNSGLCIYCAVILYPDDEHDREWNRKHWAEYTGAPGEPETYED